MPTLDQYVSLSRSDLSQTWGTSASLDVDERYQAQMRDIGTTEETIVLDTDVIDPGILYIRNDDASNYLDIGFATGDYPNSLYPGEQCLIPLALTQTTIYLKADTAAVRIEFFVNERRGVTPSASPSASVSSSPSSSPSASVSASPCASPTASASSTPSASPSASPCAS